MNSKTNSASRAKRNQRRRFCQRIPRSIGLECLENRTVFASDLTPLLDEVGICFALPVEESRVAQNSNRMVELSNSPLSLLQGDVIRIEVPESILLQLTNRDSYELQVFFSENYFSDEANNRSPVENNDIAGKFIVDTHLSSQPLSNHPTLGQSALAWLSQNDPSSSEGNALVAPSNDTSHFLGQYSSIILASLTASNDFDGTIRLFDFVPVSSQLNSNGTLEGLPNEVRIEPRATVPTAMRDPGATLVKTIVVNRAASGLTVSAENRRIEPATNGGTAILALPEKASIAAPTENSLEQKLVRSVVTQKTIDISLARRNEIPRPWIRSSSIPNPATLRESGAKRTDSESARFASMSAVKTDVDGNKPTRRELRVAGTQLQPVEFLLAKSDFGEEQAKGLDAERILATDRAFHDYADEESIENLPNWGETGLNPDSLLQSDRLLSKWPLLPRDASSALDRNEIEMLSQLAALHFTPIHGGVAFNKESWKNVLRTASESTAGQTMLASFTTLAVQYREINTLGSKSAWEFVTKTTQTVL